MHSRTNIKNLKSNTSQLSTYTFDLIVHIYIKLEKKYAPALDNYGQSCFVRSDFFKMKCHK